MDGRKDPNYSDRRRFAARRGVCAGIAVLLDGAERTAVEDRLLSRCVALAVQTSRRMEVVSVSAAFRRVDGRDCRVPDAAVRRERLCGRNARRDGSGPCGAVFRVCGAVPAADRTDAFAYAPGPFDAYEDCDPPCFAYVPAGRTDRQRESAERTDHWASGRPDRPLGRPSAYAGTVYEAVRQRRSVR